MKIFEQNWGEGEDEAGTTIYAEILPSGELLISGEDYGKSVELFKGSDTYEYHLIIPEQDHQKLMMELLSVGFNSKRLLTFSRLQRICKNLGIKAESIDR
jgi:hypothetical protein